MHNPESKLPIILMIPSDYESCKSIASLNEYLIPGPGKGKMKINLAKRLDFFARRRYNIFRRSGTLCSIDVAELCKGSTNDSDSFSLGSNPSSAASMPP